MTTRHRTHPVEAEAPDAELQTIEVKPKPAEPEPKPAEAEPEPEPEPEAEPEPEPEPEPEAVNPVVIGPPSAAMTPGWLMGIGSRPQTPAEHNARLGTSAGTFTDAGYLLGNLAPRPAWPAPPAVAVPVEVEPR